MNQRAKDFLTFLRKMGRVSENQSTRTGYINQQNARWSSKDRDREYETLTVRKNGMFTGTVQVVDWILFSKDVDIDQYNAGFVNSGSVFVLYLSLHGRNVRSSVSQHGHQEIAGSSTRHHQFMVATDHPQICWLICPGLFIRFIRFLN